MFVYGDCIAVIDFICLSATGVAEIAESTDLKGCPHTCTYNVYRELYTVHIACIEIVYSVFRELYSVHTVYLGSFIVHIQRL